MPSRPLTHRRTNQLTRWTNHAHSLTQSHGKDERKRTHGGGSHSCCSQRNIPCPRGGKIIVPFTERQEARELHRVGRFEPLQLSFPRVPFSSLLEYWKRDIWHGEADQRWRQTVFIQPPTEVLFFEKKAASVTIAIGFELISVVRPIKSRNLSK